MNNQSGILAPVPKHARFLLFDFQPQTADLSQAIEVLQELVDGEESIAGFGPSFMQALGKEIPGLRPFPSMAGAGFDVPSTQHALWIWLRGEDRGELLHRTLDFEISLAMDFQLEEVLDCFMYDTGRDLTGYIDGTENPEGNEAVKVAIVQGQNEELDGSSFVAVQQWKHDFETFDDMPEDVQDNTIGRRKSDNEELSDAPESAHVKRTAQESFTPEAFMLRRSMPWSEGNEAGLNFVAFGKSLDAFEVMMKRMAGLEDGIPDALFNFTRPLSGGYYWCPPMKDGKLNLNYGES